MKQQQRGFTLIELLVVIAIIGLLATIVMVSLNTARGKAANAAIKGNLKTMQTQAEMIYDSAASYATVCTEATNAKVIAQLLAISGVAAECVPNGTTGYAVQSSLKIAEGAFNFWCVDNTGNSKGEAAALSGATVCP